MITYQPTGRFLKHANDENAHHRLPAEINPLKSPYVRLLAVHCLNLAIAMCVWVSV